MIIPATIVLPYTNWDTKLLTDKKTTIQGIRYIISDNNTEVQVFTNRYIEIGVFKITLGLKDYIKLYKSIPLQLYQAKVRAAKGLIPLLSGRPISPRLVDSREIRNRYLDT